MTPVSKPTQSLGAAVTRVLFVIDVQNDFCEGGSLGVDGGAELAKRITSFIALNRGDYSVVIASRDWHDAHNDNGGHFAQPSEEPDFVATWPPHCIAGSSGAEYQKNLDTELIDIHIEKGQGKPAYSIFEGVTPDGQPLEDVLQELEVTDVDVVGIATDYCVLASALDAKSAHLNVRVLAELTAGVAAETSERALQKLEAFGVDVVRG